MKSPRRKQMEQALRAVVTRIQKKLDEPIVPEFENHGQTNKLTCSEECMYAEAQRLKKSIKQVHTEIQTEGNYYQEKAVAQLATLSAAYEKMALQYAEIHQSYGESAALVRELIPALDTVATGGHSMWNHLVEVGLVEKK
jgi:protein-arginine kinase activator protein McsA